MEKAGSTSIQRLLRDNGAALRRAGVAYPLAGSDRGNHNFLASAYIPLDSDRLSRGARRVGRRGLPGLLAEHRTAIMAEIGKHDRVVISGEHLFRLAAGEVGALKRDLEAAGVRETGFLASCAARPRSISPRPADEGLGHVPFAQHVLCSYSARAAGWLEHFDCAFLEFRTLANSDLGIIGTFIQQLEQALGVDLSDLPRTVRDANDSMSPEEMQLVQNSPAMVPGRRWLAQPADHPAGRGAAALSRRELAQAHPSSRSRGTDLEERHRNDVEALAALTGVALAVSPGDTLGGPIMAQQARDILANFDEALHRRLVTRVCSSRYLGFRTKVRQPGEELAVAAPAGRRRLSEERTHAEQRSSVEPRRPRIENHDLVGLLDRGQPVRDDEAGRPAMRWLSAFFTARSNSPSSDEVASSNRRSGASLISARAMAMR